MFVSVFSAIMSPKISSPAGRPPPAAGIPNLNTLPDTSGLPSFNISDSSISNFGNQNCNCPLLESEQVFQLNNNWTKVIGNHTIKFGGDIRYALNLRNASDNNRSGVLNFNSGASAGPNGVGSGLASLLFGDVNEFQRFDVYQNDAANRQKRLAFYGQDSYRVTPKLTVNYGVRWDIIYPETVNGAGKGGFSSLVSGGTRVAGVAGIGTNGNQQMDYLNLAGRFGFAYQVLPGYSSARWFQPGLRHRRLFRHYLRQLFWPTTCRSSRTKTSPPATQSVTLQPPWRLRPYVRRLQRFRPMASFRSATPSTHSFAPSASSCRRWISGMSPFNSSSAPIRRLRSHTSATMQNASTPARPMATISTLRFCRLPLRKLHRVTSLPVDRFSTSSSRPTTVHPQSVAAMA